MKDNIQIFDNATVRVDAENLVCITDIYNIAIERGLDGGKLDPRRWAEKPRSIKSGTSSKISFTERDGYKFVEFIAKSLNVAACDIYKTTHQPHGGTSPSCRRNPRSLGRGGSQLLRPALQ